MVSKWTFDDDSEAPAAAKLDEQDQVMESRVHLSEESMCNTKQYNDEGRNKKRCAVVTSAYKRCAVLVE